MLKDEKNLDKENLRKIILDFPKQFEKGIEAAESIHLSRRFDSLVISGMGGSCLPGELFKTYLEANEKNNFPIFLNRTYQLPRDIPENSLYFFISYSGNTEETLSSLNEAIEKKLPCVCFASGGKMLEICQEKNISCAILPSGVEPRYALGYFFGAFLKTLTSANLIEENFDEIIKATEKLEELQPELEKKGEEIAKVISEKTPIIYTTDRWKSLAMILKIKINESANTPAFWNYFPELNHNEMEGFNLPRSPFQILTLVDPDEHPQNIKRMQFTADIYKENGTKTVFYEIQGENTFLKMFSTLIFGDWVSYHLALLYGQDPTPSDVVGRFKKLIA